MSTSLSYASEIRHLVYTKASWADAWIQRPLLEALNIASQAAPAHSSAVLRWRYGKTIQPAIGNRLADTTLTTIGRGGFLGMYVKIVLDTDPVNPLIWYGIIQDNNDDTFGRLDGIVPSGVETYTAFGLTWLLDQMKPVTQSVVKTDSDPITIDRAIPFNGGSDGSKRPNRISSDNYDQDDKIFTDRDNTNPPSAWKAKDAIEYLFENFPPKNAAGDVLVTFALHATALSYLNYELPFTAYDGMSVWQIINKIIDRKRGLGWHAIVESGAVQIVVWSQNRTLINLPSGGVIPANANQVSYDFSDAINIMGAAVSSTLLTRYDQILCVGERAGSVFTVSPANMEPDWKSADETKYNVAASTLTGYSDLSASDKQAANQDRRAADDLSRVFSWVRLKKDWDGKSAVETGDAPYAIPRIDADGYSYLDEKADVIRSGLRFERFMPLRPHVDYTAAITPETSDVDDDEGDYLPPFVLIKASALRATEDAGWIHCERLNQASLANSSKRPFEYSIDLAVREEAPGLILRTVGVPQHYIAEDRYEANESFEEIPSGEGVDSTDWLGTVYVLHDQYCRAQYPRDAALPSLDLVRQLRIHVPDAHLDFLIAGSVVGVEGGKLKKSTDGGYLRDDRLKVRDIARLAYAWYGQTRRTLQLPFRAIVGGFSVGSLITSIGSGWTTTDINTCITSVSYDLTNGTTQLHTQFGELDFTP